MAIDTRKRTKLGDVIEIQTSLGLSYIQYVGKHPEYGDAVRVLPQCYQQRPIDFTQLMKTTACYMAFYSANAAVAAGFAEVVAALDVPEGVEVPRHLRRAGARSRDQRILSWIIEGNGQETVHKELSDAQKRLPIAAIWDHELLVQRIEEKWSPEQEG